MKSKASIVEIAAGVATVMELTSALTLLFAFVTWSGTRLAIVLNFPSCWIVLHFRSFGVRLSSLGELGVMTLIHFVFWFVIAYGVIRLYSRFTDR